MSLKFSKSLLHLKKQGFMISPKTKYPTIAAIKGIAANINNVTAAVVMVIEKMKPIKAVLKNRPPRIPGRPILKKFL